MSELNKEKAFCVQDKCNILFQVDANLEICLSFEDYVSCDNDASVRSNDG
jgi:hypothetical protein